MPELGTVFQSRFLRATDLNGKRTRATIADVTLETVGQGSSAERKFVLRFDEAGLKPLIANKTNSLRIAELVGSTNTDDWAGNVITLVKSETEFQGRVMPCIRIDAAPAKRRVPDQIDEAMPTVEEEESVV